MRSLVVIAAFVAHAATAAVSFPPALSPEQPVSERAFGAAAGNQQTLAIASNGQIAFAVWFDQRRGGFDLYGSRIGADGASLDPLGIPIANNVRAGNVFWNGSDFVVISQYGIDTTFSFVTPEGLIADRKSMQIPFNEMMATLGSGSDTRLLIAGNGVAAILDSQANVVRAGVPLTTPFETLRAAGGSGSEFLILSTKDSSSHLVADRIDREGKYLGTVDTGLDLSDTGTTLALAGGVGEYLLVSRGPADREGFLAYLDQNGVKKSVGIFAPYDSTLRLSNPPATPGVLFDGSVYQITWTTSEANGRAHTWSTYVSDGPGASTLPLGEFFTWTGTGYGVVMAMLGSQLIVITDAFRAGVSTSIDPVICMSPYHRVLSSTATLQTTPQAASAANGYAVVWNEYGPDGSTHLYLRRFSQALSGASVDAAPLEVASDAGGRAITASITAAGDVYVIAWTSSVTSTGSDYVVRRFSATTGWWLDAEPVPLANAKELVLGSNGDGALAVYTVSCPAQERCLRARAIATDAGAPLRGTETTPSSILAYALSIDSNGHDYLIAWNDDPCASCDVIYPSRLVALRLAADGMPLDTTPIVLNGPELFLASASIAWSGSNYAVSWVSGSSILGVHISPSGVKDAAHEMFPRPLLLGSHRLVANGTGLLLLMTRQTDDGATTSGIAVNPQSLLAIGEPALLVADQPRNATVSAATLPIGVAIAYDRVDPAAANVPRVFAQVFGSVQRRRTVR